MHLQAKSADICQTCIHVSDCAHFQHCQNQGKAIFHCENFDNQPVLQVVENEILYKEEYRPQPSKPSIAYIQGRMKGLCMNCEKRVSCKYLISDGGVWHCEEYC